MSELLYTRDMLAERFADWNTLRLEAYAAKLDKGQDQSERLALIDLIARCAAQ